MATFIVNVMRRVLPPLSRYNNYTCVCAKVFKQRSHCDAGFSISNGHFRSSFHSSVHRSGLMEFFDDKENWSEKEVKVGRPWRMDELRLKSNTDLHKLWYVLLKERNMLLTMEAEYERLCELFPSPERIEKVEESMENLLAVVAERDRAVKLCETGETGEGGERLSYDILGREFTRRNQEHYVPRELSGWQERRYAWQEKYLNLYREKQMKRAEAKRLAAIRKRKTLRKLFPNADIDDEEEVDGRT